MRRHAVALLICLGASLFPCSAEIYLGIGPLDTFADVKLLFPNGKFERLEPAWAQPQDVLYSISGAGISGTIIVKFYDGRPGHRSRLETETDDTRRKLYEQLSALTDDEALSVEWVRWIPVEPIPLKRFIAKYGEPDAAGFRDDNMAPYRRWSRGVFANLDDDAKTVLNVEFSFTEADERAAWKAKYNFIPDHLRLQPSQDRKTKANSKRQ